MSRGPFRLSAAVLALAVAACGGQGEQSEQSARFANADTTEQQAQLMCAEAALIAPAGTCEGAWKYNAWKTPCEKPHEDPICGVAAYKQHVKKYTYRECRWRGAGVERIARSSDGSLKTTYTGLSESYAMKTFDIPSHYGAAPDMIIPASSGIALAFAAAWSPTSMCVAPPSTKTYRVDGSKDIKALCKSYYDFLMNAALGQKTKHSDGTADEWNQAQTYGGYPTYEGSYQVSTRSGPGTSCTICMQPTGCKYLSSTTTYNGSTYNTYSDVAYGGTPPSGKKLTANTATFCDINVQRYKLGTPPAHNTIFQCPTLPYGACPEDAYLDSTGKVVLGADGKPEKSCPVASSVDVTDIPEKYNACRPPDGQQWNPPDPDVVGACGVVAGSELYSSTRPDPGQNPTCLTLNADTSWTTQAMYQRLTDNLSLSAPGVDQTTLREISIRKLKLLLEIHGDELTPAQVTAIYELYQTRPDLPPPCGTSWSSPGAPNAALDASMQACHRSLQYPASTVKSAAVLATQCIDAGQATSLPASDPTRTAYLDAYRSKILPFLDRVLSSGMPHVASEDAINADLQERLALINRWYGYATAGLYADDATRWDAVNAVRGSTWRGTYAEAMDAFRRSPKASGNVQDLAIASLRADRELLKAMFSDRAASGAPPLTRAPALYFVSDAMRAITERLDAFAPYHNLGCLYAQCAEKQVKTELGAMARVLSAVGNDTTSDTMGTRAFAAALADARGFQSAYPENFSNSSWPLYVSVFDKISDKHAAVLQAAVKDAVGASAYDQRLLILPNPNVPPPVFALQSEVLKAIQRWNAFASSGLFLRGPQKVLTTALLASKIDNVRDGVTQALAALETKLHDYQSNQQSYVTDLLGQIDNQQATTNLQQRADSLFERIRALSEDEQGLRISASLDEARFGDVGVQLMEALKGESSQYLGSDPKGPYLFNGADGQYPGILGYPAAFDVRGVAKRGIENFPLNGVIFRGSTGTIVNTSVTGQYQPTCSLLELNGSFNGVPIYTDGLEGAKTGSYGFGMTSSNGKMQSHEYSSSDADAFWVKLEMCIKAQVTQGTPAASTSQSIEACAGFSHTHTDTSTDMNGTQARTQADFSVGVRLPNTPFPDYPTGALLAVLTRPDAYQVSDILSVQVVGEPMGTIVFNEPADLYFVVNDRKCSTSMTSETLSVSLTRLDPLSGAAAAEQLTGGLTRVQGYLDEQQTIILGQGRLLPDQMAQVKAHAISLLPDLASMPRSLANFFQAWLDYKLRGIERQLELKSIHREMDQLVIEANAVRADLDLQATRSGYADLLPRLALRNLEYSNDDLNTALTRLISATADDLYPLVYLRYPDTFQYITSDTTRLLGFSWLSSMGATTSPDGGVDTIARSVKVAVDDLLYAFKHAVDRSNDTNVGDARTKWVAVHFPNPRNPPAPADRLVPYPGAFADEGRARLVWDAILSGLSTQGQVPRIEFEIRPEDLYTPSSGDGVKDGLLDCFATAPSIRAAAAYFVTPLRSTAGEISGKVEILNSLHYTRGAGVPDLMMVPTLHGVEQVWIDNVNFTATGNLSANYGSEYESTDIVSKLLLPPNDVLGSSVQGVSPFTQFQIDSFNGLGDPWWDPDSDWRVYPDGNLRITDFAVVMLLEYRSTARPDRKGVQGVTTCP